jgi:coenzyme F420-dependent glucose-6-phosphate dehydrogenase
VLAEIRKWQEAGFDRIALHQVGPDQDGFFRFWEQELQPALS